MMKGAGLVVCVLAVLAVARADSPDLNTKSTDNAEDSPTSKLAEFSDTSKNWSNGPDEGAGYFKANLHVFADRNEYNYDFDPNISKLNTRMIPYNEVIYAHSIPGANNALQCSREGELHNLWTSVYQCLVCACIREGVYLRAVCASCAGCSVPPPPSEELTLPPFFPTTPPTPLAPIKEEVTCKPLPSGQPFENPLHPCQICICLETFDAFGRPDVHIKCHENPQCVLPKDIQIIPSIPEVPVPSPYCDKFPTDVVFPHPSNVCKTCQCSVQVSQLGIVEKLLICAVIPDCRESSPETPMPYVIEPSWPPPSLRPPPPGPLPGPSPHESCQPYAPSTPFQHPWDECQVCVCMESYSAQLTNVELFCYTKLSCCIEPPYELAPSSIPLVTIPQQPKGKIRVQDPFCELKSFGVEFTHPNDQCVVCTCDLQGTIIAANCHRSYSAACVQSYSEGGVLYGSQNKGIQSYADGGVVYGSQNNGVQSYSDGGLVYSSQNKGIQSLADAAAGYSSQSNGIQSYSDGSVVYGSQTKGNRLTGQAVEWNTQRPGLGITPQVIVSQKQLYQQTQVRPVTAQGTSYLGYSQGHQLKPAGYSQAYYNQGHAGYIQQQSALSGSSYSAQSLPYYSGHQTSTWIGPMLGRSGTGTASNPQTKPGKSDAGPDDEPTKQKN